MGLELRAHHLGIMVVVLGGAAAVLSAMGRPWWCRAGDLSPWSLDIWSRHNSQHLVDPYTISHVLHGVALYGLLCLVLRRWVAAMQRATIALGVEVLWELVENTKAMIERYRATTISLDNYGDSVINSLGDIVGFVIGYLAAAVIPTWVSVAGFFATEAALVLWIRDSLLLNVLMLLYPLDAVKAWQMGKMPPP